MKELQRKIKSEKVNEILGGTKAKLMHMTPSQVLGIKAGNGDCSKDIIIIILNNLF